MSASIDTVNPSSVWPPVEYSSDGGAADFLDWLSCQTQATPVFNWAERAKGHLDPPLVLPANVSIQLLSELLNGRELPVARIEQLVLQSAEESLACRVVRRGPLA